MRIEESIIVNRPHEEVFAFFDERSNDSRWMATVIESEWVDPQDVTGLGRRGRMVMNVMGRQEFSDEVIEYEPDRKVAHRSVSNGMVVYSACLADPVPEGTRATVVTEPERLPGGPLGALIAPFIGRGIRRNVRADLVRLKLLLEDGDGPDPESSSSPTRALGAAGVIAPLVFTISAITQSLARPEHSLVRDPVSALAASADGWIQDVTFLVTGLLMLGFAWGMHLGVRPRGRFDLAGLFLALFGVGLVGAGVFPSTDAGGVFIDDRAAHLVAGLVTFASAGLAGVALTRRLRKDPRWRDLAGYVRIVGVTLIVLFIAVGILVRPAGAPLHDYLGLSQWIILAVWFPCVVMLGRRLLQGTSGPSQ